MTPNYEGLVRALRTADQAGVAADPREVVEAADCLQVDPLDSSPASIRFELTRAEHIANALVQLVVEDDIILVGSEKSAVARWEPSSRAVTGS
ncbi:hypothetical protein [Nocardiopsis sp. NPDC006938]|uniref:hypothetical protein n=1 Tax=Nocardiopsis sp. NPDC006938 TaxID=3364337 RepID=UPI0036A2196B